MRLQVNASFYLLAADLCDITLSRQEIEQRTEVIKAEIINHDQNDENVNAPDLRGKKGCSVQ